MLRAGSGLGLIVLVAVAVMFFNANAQPRMPVDTSTARVVAVFPHDPTAFCQGLVVEGETVYEGTGKYESSELRVWELKTGQIEKRIALGDEYFGEGVTIIGDRIYQLTWRNRICVVYDKATLKPLGSLRYTGEGWGITDDEEQIYLSDGTSTIRVLDPQTFKEKKRLRVRHGRRLVDQINELEFVNGEIYANIWYSDLIARIDPKSGEVLGWIDCRALYPARERPDREHVLNGIAYDAEAGRLFVTGKYWSKLFEIVVDDAQR